MLCESIITLDLKNIIEDYRLCKECEPIKQFVPTEIPFTPFISAYSFERLHNDVTYPKEFRIGGNRFESYLVTAKDHFSGYFWASLVQRRDSTSLAHFYQTIINEVGISPSIAHVDQGSEFRGDFNTIVDESGAQLVNHPQSNGSNERANGQIKPLVTLMICTEGGTYSSNLREALSVYNRRPGTVTTIDPQSLFASGSVCNQMNSKISRTKHRAEVMSRSLNNTVKVKFIDGPGPRNEPPGQ